jgi:ATP-dependent protease ClpP protease subunit
MRKHLVINVMLFAILAMMGCAQNIPPPASVQPQEVIVKVVTDGDAKAQTDHDVSRTMQIPYDEPEFDTYCKQVGDTLYFPVWSYINSADTLLLWKNLQVAKHKGIKKLHIYVNSGGGSGFDGLGISDVLIGIENEGMEVTTEANGLVASAAVPIFVVGQHRIATASTMFMIHESSLFKFIADEKRSDLITQAKMMEMLEARYNKLISERSKLSIEDLKEKCKATTWFTAQEALEWGLVDEIK